MHSVKPHSESAAIRRSVAPGSLGEVDRRTKMGERLLQEAHPARDLSHERDGARRRGRSSSSHRRARRQARRARSRRKDRCPPNRRRGSGELGREGSQDRACRRAACARVVADPMSPASSSSDAARTCRSSSAFALRIELARLQEERGSRRRDRRAERPHPQPRQGSRRRARRLRSPTVTDGDLARAGRSWHRRAVDEDRGGRPIPCLRTPSMRATDEGSRCVRHRGRGRRHRSPMPSCVDRRRRSSISSSVGWSIAAAVLTASWTTGSRSRRRTLRASRRDSRERTGAGSCAERARGRTWGCPGRAGPASPTAGEGSSTAR